MDAYLSGLEQAKDAGIELSSIRSVASFFVSRIDTEVEKRLDALADADGGSDEIEALRSKAAIANARLAYQAFEDVFSSDRWSALEAAGAHKQRPLWASTSVKDPDLPDTMYVDGLVAPDTVNTMPEATIDATADHGEITGDTITPNYEDAQQVIDRLENVGVSYDEVVQAVEDEGVDKFEKSWKELQDTVDAALKGDPDVEGSK
jgi:transaldolase